MFYNHAINEQVQHDFLLEEKLKYALENNEMSVVYQPQLNANSSQICSVEALVRWFNDSLGHVSPVEFIRLAEDIGVVNEIGLFVARQACADLKTYNSTAKDPIGLSINVSPKQLLNKDFSQSIFDVVSESGLAFGLVTLEITENVMIHNPKEVGLILQQLRDYGFGLSLDDFGTGYSSLSYINTLPISEIKIDRSFVDKMVTSEQSNTLVKSIVAIAHSSGLDIVAEGVETQEQLDQLVAYRCDMVQGYYFDKPLSLEELISNYQG